MQDLGRRASALDVDNRDLHTQLAQANQQVKLFSDEVSLLRGRLNETASQLREFQVAKVQTDSQLAALEATTTRGGSARIHRKQQSASVLAGHRHSRHSSSSRRRFDSDRIADRSPLPPRHVAVTASRHDGCWIRLRESLREIIHDSSSASKGTPDTIPTGSASSHQLSTAQSSAVLESLTRRSRFPVQQLFTAGYGGQPPRCLERHAGWPGAKSPRRDRHLS